MTFLVELSRAFSGHAFQDTLSALLAEISPASDEAAG
jgi:hypothetical protein